jgi:hypothetical protein
LLLLACTVAQAQPVESFYRGKTINLIIGYPPAGANDTYARDDRDGARRGRRPLVDL